jgi:hypothetical protein
VNFFPTKIIVKVVVIELQIDGLITTPLPNKEITDLAFLYWKLFS